MSEPAKTSARGRGEPASGRCRAFVALLLVLLAATPAAAITYGEIEVNVISEPRDHPSHGYIDYRFLVRNKATSGTRVVRIAVPGTAYSPRTGHIQSVGRTFEVEAGKVVTVSLLVPSRPELYGNGAAVWIDGRMQNDHMALSLTGGRGFSRHSGGRGDMLVYYSQRVPEDFFMPAVRGRGAAGGGMKPVAAAGGIDPGEGGMGAAPAFYLSGQQVRADGPISTWSRHWLGYSRFDGLVVTSEDLGELARAGNDGAAILQALRQYTETGGALVVLGPGKVELPAWWLRMKHKHYNAETTTASVAGSLIGSRMTNPMTRTALAVFASRFSPPPVPETYGAGFGRCIVTPDRDSAKWSSARWAQFEDAWSGTARNLQSTRSLLDLNTTLPVVDDLGLPVRGLFVLMVLFTVAIGPVNLWLLTRWKRRIWLLWIVPMASSLTCMAVFSYMVLSEGWQGHTHVAGLTILDEGERRATTIGRCGFYSPLTPSDGLHFSQDTEVTPTGHEHAAFNNSVVVDWTIDQHLSRGWVSARVPSHFTMRKSELRREDIKVDREGKSLVVTNRLGHDIKSLVLADETGKLYRGDAVAAGEKTVLSEMPGKLTTQPMAWRTSYGSGDWIMAMKDAVKKPDQMLVPNSYLAVVDGTPFLEQGLRGAQVRPTESVVLGLMAGGK